MFGGATPGRDTGKRSKAGRYSKHQSQYRQGFCGWCAQAPSRTSERATGRCNNAPFLVCTTARLAPSGAISGVHRAHVGHLFFGRGGPLFHNEKRGFIFSREHALICSGPRGHPNLALDSAAKSLDVSQSSAYADAPRLVRASAKQGHIRWGMSARWVRA